MNICWYSGTFIVGQKSFSQAKLLKKICHCCIHQLGLREEELVLNT
jgi:hypothetical protein